jgi:hypothetical protein
MIIPLFVEGDQFSSTLTLINNATSSTYADLTLRGLDGKAIVTKRVDFNPHSQRRVDIGKLLDSKASTSTAGSILVTPSGALAGPSIGAVLSMTYLGYTDPNYIDEEIFVPNVKGSQVLQGVADRGEESPILAVSSLAESSQLVQIQCFGDEGVDATRSFTLAAGETLITDACTGPDVHDSDLASVLQRSNGGSRGPQGIRLVSDAAPGSFAAFAMARHNDKGDRFFSSVLFSDPKTIDSPNTVFTGVPVGPATLLPAGLYVPELTLTNFTSEDIHIHVIFAHTTEDAPSVQDVGSLTVPSRSTRELVLSNMRGDPTLQNSFIVYSDGAPGDLIAKYVSRGDSQLHEVELQAKDYGDMQNAGGHPWSIEGSAESTLLLFNHSNSMQAFTVRVSTASVEWQKEFTLAPMQTKAIGIRELVDEQVKDDRGRTLPKDSQSGEAGWLVTDFATSSGRLLQSDRSIGMARNFSCGYSGLLCGASITFYHTLLPDGIVEEFADLTGITCTSGQPNECSGQQTGTANFSTTWVSVSPSIASISGSSTSPSVNMLGAALGTSQVNGQLRSTYCSTGAGGTATVIPQILMAGVNVTSQTEAVVVGQQVALSASYSLPSGVSVTSQSWSVPGTTVGGYNASVNSGQTIATNFSQQSNTFYWVTPGSSLVVTYTVKLSNGSSSSASTTFNVSGPTSAQLATSTSAVHISTISGQPYLQYGNQTAGVAGITFTGSATNSSGGSFSFVHLITSYQVVRSSTCSYSPGTGLDNYYPFPSSGSTASDSPASELYSSESKVSESFGATMYLMWQSSTSGSIPVPLGYVPWQWSGTAVQNAGVWTVSSGSGSASAFVSSTAYPTWTTHVTNGNPPCE